ncbi:MAG: hypothetical protein U5K38_08495 [Woeseiaceae bacterium]|nr:hypothetical protein [Woeseiaceae bacterium]
MSEMHGTRTLSTSLGHRITVFSNDFIGKKIARVGLYEKESLEYLNALLSRMDAPVVLDIGANIGNHALAFATQAMSRRSGSRSVSATELSRNLALIA